MDMLDIFVPIDTGTDYMQRYIINPVLLLLLEAQAQAFRGIMRAFGIGPREVKKT